MNLSEWSERFAQAATAVVAADPGHDINHIKRVVKSATEFGQAEGAEMAVVLPAAWLHDCVAVAKDSPLRQQASRLAADQAVAWLQEWGYPESHLPAIHHAIVAHSFSAAVPCETLEAQVVQDADRMDALGAIGIARTLMVGTTFGNPLLHHQDPFCHQRQADDKVAIIDHFYTKLLTLKDSFHTQAAQAEARKRHDYMQKFLQQLEQEMALA